MLINKVLTLLMHSTFWFCFFGRACLRVSHLRVVWTITVSGLLWLFIQKPRACQVLQTSVCQCMSSLGLPYSWAVSRFYHMAQGPFRHYFNLFPLRKCSSTSNFCRPFVMGYIVVNLAPNVSHCREYFAQTSGVITFTNNTLVVPFVYWLTY